MRGSSTESKKLPVTVHDHLDQSIRQKPDNPSFIVQIDRHKDYVFASGDECQLFGTGSDDEVGGIGAE